LNYIALSTRKKIQKRDCNGARNSKKIGNEKRHSGIKTVVGKEIGKKIAMGHE
jgi:hypothetical protein